MKKIAATLLLLLSLNFIVIGQYNISGKITEKESGKALPSAHVVLEGTYMATSSGSDGTYLIRNIASGKYTLKVSFMGFRSEEKEIDLKSDLVLDFSLEASAIMENEVIISATRAGDKSPTTYSNLSKKKIEDLNFGQDLPYLLETTPSVVTTSDAGTGVGYTGIRIRGTDLTRINVTIDGVPLNDPESQGVWWVDLPDIASSTQNIQIQRGVGTSTNGSGAFGASINIETESPSPVPYAEVNSAAGIFQHLQKYF